MTSMTSVATTGLRAVTREVDPVDDVLDALGPDGFAWIGGGHALVTSGVAAVVPAAHALETLLEIDADDDVARPGSGPIAVGALPFVPDQVCQVGAGIDVVLVAVIRNRKINIQLLLRRQRLNLYKHRQAALLEQRSRHGLALEGTIRHLAEQGPRQRLQLIQ